MRNMSFTLTTSQVRARQKSVTRRLGWRHLQQGELLCAVEKGRGLKPGEKLVRLSVIRVVSVQREPLCRMTDDPEYGMDECKREGFGEHLRPQAFVDFFCASHRGCTPKTEITRIEFEYVNDL